MFVVAVGPHPPQLAVTLHGLKNREFETARDVVLNQWMDTDDYKLKTAAGAFLQGESERDGWILIEFWQNNREAIDAFVAHLNKRVFDNDGASDGTS